MSRKHNCKHNRGKSKYKKRLEARGLGRTPTMKWTGWSTQRIQEAWAALPSYRWKQETVVDDAGRSHVRHFRVEVR